MTSGLKGGHMEDSSGMTRSVKGALARPAAMQASQMASDCKSGS